MVAPNAFSRLRCSFQCDVWVALSIALWGLLSCGQGSSAAPPHDDRMQFLDDVKNRLATDTRFSVMLKVGLPSKPSNVKSFLEVVSKGIGEPPTRWKSLLASAGSGGDLSYSTVPFSAPDVVFAGAGSEGQVEVEVNGSKVHFSMPHTADGGGYDPPLLCATLGVGKVYWVHLDSGEGRIVIAQVDVATDREEWREKVFFFTDAASGTGLSVSGVDFRFDNQGNIVLWGICNQELMFAKLDKTSGDLQQWWSSEVAMRAR